MKSFRSFLLLEFDTPFEIKRPEDFDMIVVGGGPGGVQAAIMAGSDKFRVLVIDAKTHLGGQSRQSRSIENFAGFPKGITGKALYGRIAQQAAKFNVRLATGSPATNIAPIGKNFVITDGLGNRYVGKSVVLAVGITPTPLPETLNKWVGKGVYYGMPEHMALKGDAVFIGGGNSTGQAVEAMVKAGNKVWLVARSPIKKSMSSYMVERMRAFEAEGRLEILEGEEVTQVNGQKHVRSVTLKSGRTISTNQVFTFLGGKPHTEWLQGKVDLNEKGYIKTDPDKLYQTNMPGVFAIGDGTERGKGRIAAAVGEGAGVVSAIQNYLDKDPGHTYSGGGLILKNAAPKKDEKFPCKFPWQRAADKSRCGARAQTAPQYGSLPSSIRV